MRALLRATTILAGIAAATIGTMGSATADEPQFYTSSAEPLALGEAAFKDGNTLHLTIGIGSAAFHGKDDPANVIWTVSDRGPNIDCGEAEALIGLDNTALCQGEKAGKIFPLPGFVPSIFRIELGEGGVFSIAERLELRGKDGAPISGVSNPLTSAKTELAFDSSGAALPLDPSGLDTEGLVRLSDGTFWLADEYGPSLVHVAADGTIIERLVPAGLEADLAAARYDVRGTLPAVLMKRQLNRGAEGIALSPDEKFLYMLMQNPLANPDADAYKGSAMARLVKLDAASGTPVAEYVYVLDRPETFTQDEADKQNAVRLSELVALGEDDLIVLERIDKTTKLHRISLAGATDVLGTAWDDVATGPSLEQLDAEGLKAAGIAPVAKTLVMDSATIPGLPAKIEGVALMGGDDVVLINDDDFGIAGATTSIIRLKLPLATTN